MGLNVNLVMMLGVPATSHCPKCGKSFGNNFDDYDVECGHPNMEKGIWNLSNYCSFCEHEWTEKFVIQALEKSEQ